VLRLMKPALDVGIYTDKAADMRSFYEGDLGLPYNHLLKVGRGVHQHRLDLDGGGVLKLNDSRDPLPEEPSGYVALALAGAVPREGHDPDGLPVDVVKQLHGDTRVAVTVASGDPDAHDRWFADGLGATRLGDGRYSIGSTLIVVVDRPDQPRSGGLSARGLRYLTVQVADVVAEHQRLVDLGYEQALAPTRLGDVSAISFVRDPGGNWLEVSQRAALTGELPDNL
jgi:hypothetical protein